MSKQKLYYRTEGIIESWTKKDKHLLITVVYPVEKKFLSNRRKKRGDNTYAKTFQISIPCNCIELGSKVSVSYNIKNPKEVSIDADDANGFETKEKYVSWHYTRFKNNGYNPIHLFGSWCLVRHKSKNYTKFSYYRPFNLAKHF